jgi:predicted pyridoxine 5'-phosphate oxidase superfamily flavin-nucleotide-binding protein
VPRKTERTVSLILQLHRRSVQHVADPGVALILLIPGGKRDLRVNGTAKISVDPALLARFEVNGKLLNTVSIVTALAVFFQCAKALMRSGLWRVDRQVSRSDLPSNGESSRGASTSTWSLTRIGRRQ